MSEVFICPDCGYWGISIEEYDNRLPLPGRAKNLQCRMFVTDDIQCRECGWSHRYSNAEPA